jgi:hypothetical protein
MTAPRTPLPNRRLQQSQAVEWNGKEWVFSVGFDPAGTVREVFVKGPKAGSAMDAIMDDASVLVSLLLQAGYALAEVLPHLGREGGIPSAPPASPIGFVVQVASEIEAAEGAGVRALFDVSSHLTGRGSNPAAPGSFSEGAGGGR